MLNDPEGTFENGILRDAVISDGIAFLRSLTRCYGGIQGMEVWNKLGETIDPKLKDEIFVCLLTGEGEGVITILDIGPNKINAIKEIRSATGFGLKESKDIADRVQMGRSEKITLYNPKNRSDVIRVFRDIGMNVR